MRTPVSASYRVAGTGRGPAPPCTSRAISRPGPGCGLRRRQGCQRFSWPRARPWSRRYLAKPQRPQFTAHRRLINRNAELFEYPMRQVLSAPTHDTVDRRIGPLSTSRASACRCLSLSLAGLPVALPSIRPSGPLALKRRTQSRTTWSRQYRSAPPPCDGHHRKSQPAQEAAGSVQHPSTPWLTAEAPDHQNLPVTQPLCP